MATSEIRHKTLSAFYTSIVNLRSALHLFPNDELVRPGDPVEYESLLSGCLVAARDESVNISRPDTGKENAGPTSKGSQQEAIDRVLEEVSRRDKNNVLLFGSKNLFTFDALPINTSRPAFENRHANSPSASLRSIEWKILRARIGDIAFRDVLLYSVFLPVGNNCYAQLCGRPLFDLSVLTSGITEAIGGSKGKRKRNTEENNRQIKKRQRRTEEIPSTRSGENTPLIKDSSDVPKGAADRIVLRGLMFYGISKPDKYGRFQPGLPPHHTLNKAYPRSSHGASPSDTACLLLLRQLFPSLFVSSPSDPTSRRKKALPTEGISIRGSKARLSGITGMIRELYARHAEIDFPGLVRRLDARKGHKREELESITQNSVFRFLGGVIRKLFPATVIGSEHNQAVLLRNIRQFVEMRQHENISLHILMQGIHIDDISWLESSGTERPSPNEMKRKRQLMEDLIFWIFSEWLMPLLRNTFYITETAATRYETVYYLQADWDRETRPHLQKLQGELLEPLTPDQAHYARRGPLGISAVRLVPKPKGFRPIVNLGKRLEPKLSMSLPAFTTSKTTTANQVLRGLHQVLTCEKMRHRSQMGNTLFGTDEVFPPLQRLKRELAKKYGELPRLYFVKMDIKSAFDTINQVKMLEVVEGLLDQDNDYCIMLYSLLLPPAGKVGRSGARKLWKSQAMSNDGQSAAFTEHAKTFAKPLRNAVLVDLMRKKHVTKEDCMELLRIHIENNVWEVDGRLYRQKTGIPQGSKISSLLCSFFYAILERDHLGFTSELCSCLLRYIDDFLFVTADLALARRFIQRMQKGFPEFGAFISPTKTLLSFESASGGQVAPVCVGSDGRSYFPFCGYLIDVNTLDMSMDYQRVADTHAKQSFALRSHRKKSSAFVGWFSRQLETRNHVAYLDSQHNDIHTIRINVFLNFALSAMKIPHYFRLERDGTIGERQGRIIAYSLVDAAEYTFLAGRSRVRFAARLDKKEHCAIKKGEFINIALTAIIIVLSRKASQFKSVIHALRQRMTSDKKLISVKLDLSDIIDEGWQAVKDVKY